MPKCEVHNGRRGRSPKDCLACQSSTGNIGREKTIHRKSAPAKSVNYEKHGDKKFVWLFGHLYESPVRVPFMPHQPGTCACLDIARDNVP